MNQNFTPVSGPHVWRGRDIASRKGWLFELPTQTFSGVYARVREAAARGLTQDSYDFEAVNIAGLRDALAPGCRELGSGSGLCLIRGFDVANLGIEELKLALLTIGHHMGLVGPQEHRARGIGEVMDVNPPEGNRYYYHVGGPLPMHMDPIDVVGLLGVRKAGRGGESRIVSAMAVHNEILRTRPDLLEILYRGFRHRRREHRRDGGSPLTDYNCPVFADIGGGEIICNYIPAPIRMAVQDGLMTLSAQEEAALDLLETTAEREDFCLTMDIEPGDLQFLNNRVILHGRADYEDAGGQDQRRLLLRIWLTMRGWRKFPPNLPHMDMELQTEPA